MRIPLRVTWARAGLSFAFVGALLSLSGCGDSGVPSDELGDAPQTPTPTDTRAPDSSELVALELKVVVPFGGVEGIEYTVNCDGSSAAVRLNGNLEVDDLAPLPKPADSDNSAFRSFVDLPAGPCTIQLRARDEDGEVICSATENLEVVANETSTVDVQMICGA